LVSSGRTILSTGYNGPLQGSDDASIPMSRPEKYSHMIHAEENLLLAYHGSRQDLAESSIYVTARPCHRCLRGILRKNITRIVYGSGWWPVPDDDLNAQELMLKDRDVEIIEYKDMDKIKGVLTMAVQYMDYKLDT
jgi:deoxycytidylate deaminase